jgi:hypothetical protein
MRHHVRVIAPRRWGLGFDNDTDKGCDAPVSDEKEKSGDEGLKWSLAMDRAVLDEGAATLAKKRDFPKVLRLPLVATKGASETCVCYTWQYGDAPWISAFMPSLRKWARRQGIEVKVDSQPAIGKELRESPCKQWMEHFLASEFQWMMHMDADVMVHPLAPHILHEPREKGLWSHGQAFPASRENQWRKWVKSTFQQEVPADFVYANDGVWLMDRETAKLLLPMTSGYIAPNVPHEFYFNWWRLCLSRVEPSRLKELGHEWNHVPVEKRKLEPAWLYHCAGRDKGAVLKELQMNGFIPVPRPPMTFKPWPEKARMEKVIALPYLLEGDIWKGELLRYALRSMDMYGMGDWPLLVLGNQCPDWLDESVYRYEDKLQNVSLRAFALAEKVLWMNDDILFLRPVTEADFAVPIYLDEAMVEKIPHAMHSKNKWYVASGVIASRLHHELGMDVIRNFSTHTPYLFHRKQARKTIEFFGTWFKFPMELAYFNLMGETGRPCTEKATIGTLDDPSMRWFNVPDSEVDNPEFREWLERKYPKPSRWEKVPR